MHRCVLDRFGIFSSAVSQASDPNQVVHALYALGSLFGFKALLISEALPIFPDQTPHETLAELWPDDWPIEDARRWLSLNQRYRWIELLRGSLTLHTSDLPEQSWPASRNRAAHSEANFQDVMFVPLPQSDGRLGIVTFIGQRPEDSTLATMLLEAAAYIAFNRFRALRDSSRTYVLTYRQRLICSFLAIGKSSAEIGSILGITEATVDQHVRNCKERLGTSNRTATVVEAIRRGQLLSILSHTTHGYAQSTM